MAKTKEKTVKEKRDLRQELTEKLLSQMEKGEAFWQRPWERGEIEAPFNAVTGKSYRGVNSQNLMLFTPDPADNRWCTYKQAQEQGWQVKKGAHGVPIEKWNDYSYKLKPEEIEALKASGVAEPETEERRSRVSYFTVFHASQIEGIPPRERPEQEVHLDNQVDERLPQLAEAMGVEVGYAGTRAFYRQSTDSVNLPPVELFKSGQDHDTVFLHELSHSTGHASRLNRDLSGGFGSEKYAKEELRAELSAAMTAMSLGLGFSPDAQNQEEGRTVSGVENTSAYLTSWLKALPENDQKKELMKAISDAQKISDYLMERTPEIEKTVEMEKGQARTVEPDLAVNNGFHVGDFIITHENRFGADWNTRSILVGMDEKQVALQNLYLSGREWKVSPGILSMPVERFEQTVRHQVSGVVPPEIASAEKGGLSIARRDRIEKAVNAFHAENNLHYGKTPPTPERVPDSVRHFLGDRQALATNQLMRDAEVSGFYADKMLELNNIIMDMPKTYETDGKSDAEKVAALRYFGPGKSQFFIIEKDRGDPENEGTVFPRQQQAFGLADLGMGSPELGYINLEEITRNGAELDYHFTPTTLLEIKKEHYPELIRQTEKEAALESVREFYEHLPDHVQELMGTIKDRHEVLSPVDFEGHRKVRVDFQAGVDDVLGIIREGPDRGANKYWLTLEKAGFTPDEISKMPLMDDVQNATCRQGQTLSAFSKELDSQFTENLKAHGKEILQNSEKLNKQDMAQAVYWKHGVQVESTDNPMLNRFIDAVDHKDLPKLLSSIGHNSMNPASQEVFERITGESLGKTQKDRVETLEKWAGPDVVQAMKAEQAKKAAEQAVEKPIKNLQNRYAGLKEVLVRTKDAEKGELVLNGQEYLSSSIEKGFTVTFAKPKGAVIEYGLLNKEEGIYRTVKDTRISQFAKAVREVNPDGKILPALEKAGITLTKEKTLQEKVSERMKAKGFSL